MCWTKKEDSGELGNVDAWMGLDGCFVSGSGAPVCPCESLGE